MNIPVTPPVLQDITIKAFAANPTRFIELLAKPILPTVAGKYRHWDILRHLEPPADLTVEEWWMRIKMARLALARHLPLLDRKGEVFRYAPVDPLYKMLHEIDQQASGAIHGPDQVTDPQTRDTYLMHTLFEEAITSSQLEGASTTREVAKEMLQQGRVPRNHSEQMIYNNYQAMQFIRTVRAEALTPAIVFELHRQLTQDTLDDASAAGRLRHPNEVIQVVDEIGRVLHHPPSAEELSERMDRLCAFANGVEDEPFVHPVVRSILLHFMLGYDHPFVDGNGRTARALFYWSMARQGYWLTEFLSISRIIKKAPGKYGRAFLYTETDDNDATYFILNQLAVIVRAIGDLHIFLATKARQLDETRHTLAAARLLRVTLNDRQLALVRHALHHPGHVYTIASHRRSHASSYQTARTDLLGLVQLGLLKQGKQGKAFVFTAPDDLRKRVEARR